MQRSGRFPSHEHRLLAIGLAILAIISPLYIDRRSIPETELDEEPSVSLSFYLPVLLLLLITAIAVSSYFEHEFTKYDPYFDHQYTRFDPYWIHRTVGSSSGIIVVLVVLIFVLKCKASTVR